MSEFNIPVEFIDTLNKLRDICYNYNVSAGWYDNPREFGTRIALIHSEVSEALEGHRKNKPDDHLVHRCSPEVELADAIIRILDLCGNEGYDIGGALYEKFEYNKHRQDHKKEIRARQNGKQY